jgi:DNA-binding NtrC family response regulator
MMSPNLTPYVLVVDDDEPARTVLTRWLQRWGYDVVSVPTAADALACMREAPAAILIADVIMPTHDGLWLLKQVHEQWPETVVIMESGAEETASVLKARQYGALEYLPKPFGREQLFQALRHAVAVVGSGPAPGDPLQNRTA